MTTAGAGLSRRTLLGLGGTTLLAASAAAAWRWRTWRLDASARPRTDGVIPYADHAGWMVSLAEKQALQARSGEPAGAAR